MENHLDPESFKSQSNSMRRQLRFGEHHFEPSQLNDIGNLFEKTQEHLGGDHTAKNHEKAMEFMQKQPEWRHLAPGKQQELHSMIKSHLGIAEE